jgi:sulfide:quinone oxidoreductase
VVTPNSKWNWIPSNIWVGVGKMPKEKVEFELAPVYRKAGIDYRQALGVSLHPEGEQPYVTIRYTGQGREGEEEQVPYDYLINATGPKLNFGATPGLGPEEGHTVSVCTAGHAVEASDKLHNLIEAMKAGERKTFVIGTGHGNCTCQGAAFEYLFNVEQELREAGVREQAELIWLSNESVLADFGMGGMQLKQSGFVVSGKVFAESLYAERGVRWILGTHVNRVEEGKIHYETLDGSSGEQPFDFAMLIPPFCGVGLKAYDDNGEDISERLFAPNGLMKVDADYTPKPYEEWEAADWPRKLQNPSYPNIFAVGIAFAPPHTISKPMTNPNGVSITPTAPRTGMPSAMMGKAVAQSIRDMVQKGASEPTHTASMAEMGAACVASAGSGIFKGTAAAMTVYPIVPDYKKYPGSGRDLTYTTGEIGLAGHWIKLLLHYAFLWKAKLRPFWRIIPE